MTRISLQNETEFEMALNRGNAAPKAAHLRTGLLQEQRLTCANHSNEDISLDQIGWQNFRCPKCGDDYSIGRKITSLEQVLKMNKIVAIAS